MTALARITAELEQLARDLAAAMGTPGLERELRIMDARVTGLHKRRAYLAQLGDQAPPGEITTLHGDVRSAAAQLANLLAPPRRRGR